MEQITVAEFDLHDEDIEREQEIEEEREIAYWENSYEGGDDY